MHADHVLALLSKLVNWYMAREEDNVSPIVCGMRRTKPKERARVRVLNDAELRLLWQCSAKAGMFGAFLRLALLTGQRRAMARAMRWQDLSDNGIWHIPAEAREKTNTKKLKLSGLALIALSFCPHSGGRFVRNDERQRSREKMARPIIESGITNNTTASGHRAGDRSCSLKNSRPNADTIRADS